MTLDVTSKLWIARFLRDEELKLEASIETGQHLTLQLDEEAIQLEEAVHGFDPYNHIGTNIKE